MDVRAGLWRKVSAEELMLLNCGVGEDSWESLGLWGYPTSPSSRKSVLSSLEGLMLKLKFQYFGHLMRRTDSLKKILMLGKIEGKRRRRWQRMRWLDGITDNGNGEGQGSLVCCSPWGCTESCRELRQASLTKWRHGLKPLSFPNKHGPGMKELGLVILTCSFISLAELTKKEY